MNCRRVRFKQVLSGTVEPLYSEHLPPRVVPDMNVMSHTTSIVCSFTLMTTPFAQSGTLPESDTIVTRSPSRKAWFWSRYAACEGLRTACGGMPLTRAFLQASSDLPELSPSENFSISWMVVLAIWTFVKGTGSKSRTPLDFNHAWISFAFASALPSGKKSFAAVVSPPLWLSFANI